MDGFLMEQFLYSKLNCKALGQEMSTDKVSQELFMSVKERLDYYRLPCSFPLEVTQLIDKLLNLVSGKGELPGSKAAHFSEGEPVTAALKHQIARVVKQNNKIHMDLIVAKEQIQSLEHGLFKVGANRHSGDKELEKYSAMKHRREQELIEELRDVKYKYNELMDFLHQDPRADREYIKRLMKHKQVSVEEANGEELREVGRRQAFDQHYNIKQLELKIKNREGQIMRLQKLIEYDGVNMNKLIKNFNQDMTKKQLRNADSKINYLEESYDKIKKENKNMRNKNGLRQALRSQVEKCHLIIDDLKKENQKLRRNHHEQNFDIQKKSAETERKIGKVKSEKTHADKKLQQKDEVIGDLLKKCEFLEKELNSSKKNLQEYENVIVERQSDNENLHKKNEETKVFYEYELQTLKKKNIELEMQSEQHRRKGKDLFAELQLKIRENQLKDESIINLEKIVNQLIRKNSVVADKTAGSLEESLKKSAELEIRTKIEESQRHISLLQGQRAELEANLRTLEHRFSQVIKENEMFKQQFGNLKRQNEQKEELLRKTQYQLEETRIVLKKQQNERARTKSELDDFTRAQVKHRNELQSSNKELIEREKALKQRIKDLQMTRSEEEGVWEVTRERLAEKEEKISELQKLLSKHIDQTKLLSNNITELEHKNHELSLDNHRLNKKYEELKKDESEFKKNSYKNYETSITDSMNEISTLKKEILHERRENEQLNLNLEEMNEILRAIGNEKDQLNYERTNLTNEVELLHVRIQKMTSVERDLLIENESLRALVKSM